MATRRSRLRRLARWLATGLVCLGLIVALLPVWFPWVLRPALKRYAVGYDRYERVGYARFALRNVRFETFAAGRVESFLPTAWLWRQGTGQPTPVTVADWVWHIPDEPVADADEAADSLSELLDALHESLPALLEWAPVVRATDGAVALGAEQVEVPLVRWEGGRLSASVAHPKRGWTVTLEADLSTGVPYALAWTVEPAALALTSSLHRQPGGWELEGELNWQGNRAALSARFGREGWLPVDAKLVADTVRLPAEAVLLEGYEAVTGSVTGLWERNQFTLDVSAHATPTPGLPSAEARLRARGDLESARVEEFRLVLPWLEATLSEPVGIQYAARWLIQPVALEVAADLDPITQSRLTGKVHGTVRCDWPGDASYPRATFQLAAENLTGLGLAMAGATVTGECSGPWTAPEHDGKVVVETFSLPGISPVRVHAEWAGKGLSLAQVRMELSAGSSTLRASGAADMSAGEVTVRELAFEKAGEMLYRLDEPCRLSVSGPNVRLESLRCTGPERALRFDGDVTWPSRGSLEAQVRGARLADFQDFVAARLWELSVARVDFVADWDNGPARFELTLSGAALATEESAFSAHAQVVGNADGIWLDELIVEGESAAVVFASGSIPVTLEPLAWPRLVRLAEDQPFDLQVRTVPDKAFWDRVAEATGVRLLDPDIRLAVRGTPAEPEGHVDISARLIEWTMPRAEWSLPRLERLRLDADLRREVVRLNVFRLEVEGQPVEVSGELPADRAFWTALVAQGTLPDWKTANARLRIAHAELAPFARYLPNLFAPQGRLDVDLALRPGGSLQGTLELSDAATRPLLPLGPIRDIAARVRYTDRTATIESFSGRLGGQTVTVTGVVGLPESGPAEFDLHLRGQNVPLAREPGLVLRSDLDLRLRQGRGRPPILTGLLGLRDSLYLQDFAALIPVGPTQPARRPPYFQIEEKPFADWALDLRVQGERFLRVRSPLFRGELSASFHLTGHLREPVAVGEARVVSGVVQFPFANLRVEHGVVALRSDHPHRPEIALSAAAQSFGYQVSMKVHGPVDEPQVTFASIPSLSSEEVLLMLTAGELPRGEMALTTPQKASRLALYFGRDLLRQFGAQEETLDRLEVRSGEEFSQTGVPTYYLEYRLTDRWSVVGEYDRFNALNAGLKWRIYSR